MQACGLQLAPAARRDDHFNPSARSVAASRLKLNAEINEVLARDDVGAELSVTGIEPAGAVRSPKSRPKSRPKVKSGER
jgi:hypothetical protein